MTLAEFKAWFEGFTEDMEGSPSPKQWKRIKDRVKQIDGVAITKEVIYRDRYWRDYWSMPIWNEPLVARYSAGTADAVSATVMPSYASGLSALGKSEYSSLVAS